MISKFYTAAIRRYRISNKYAIVFAETITQEREKIRRNFGKFCKREKQYEKLEKEGKHI